ncbi:MAG: hypothetical protein QMD22_00280 [archaeon]|nr:hypothetical protein [archaeon]
MREVEDLKKQKMRSIREIEGLLLDYKLYGLNEEDIKVVEDFLKRF